MRVDLTKEEVLQLGYSMKMVIRSGAVDICGKCTAHQLGTIGMGCSDHLTWDGRPCYDAKIGPLDVKYVVGQGNHLGVASLAEYIRLKAGIAGCHM
jgi:hypothetical protein